MLFGRGGEEKRGRTTITVRCYCWVPPNSKYLKNSLVSEFCACPLTSSTSSTSFARLTELYRLNLSVVGCPLFFSRLFSVIRCAFIAFAQWHSSHLFFFGICFHYFWYIMNGGFEVKHYFRIIPPKHNNAIFIFIPLIF